MQTIQEEPSRQKRDEAAFTFTAHTPLAPPADSGIPVFKDASRNSSHGMALIGLSSSSQPAATLFYSTLQQNAGSESTLDMHAASPQPTHMAFKQLSTVAIVNEGDGDEAQGSGILLPGGDQQDVCNEESPDTSVLSSPLGASLGKKEAAAQLPQFSSSLWDSSNRALAGTEADSTQHHQPREQTIKAESSLGAASRNIQDLARSIVQAMATEQHIHDEAAAAELGGLDAMDAGQGALLTDAKAAGQKELLPEAESITGAASMEDVPLEGFDSIPLTPTWEGMEALQDIERLADASWQPAKPLNGAMSEDQTLEPDTKSQDATSDAAAPPGSILADAAGSEAWDIAAMAGKDDSPLQQLAMQDVATVQMLSSAAGVERQRQEVPADIVFQINALQEPGPDLWRDSSAEVAAIDDVSSALPADKAGADPVLSDIRPEDPLIAVKIAQRPYSASRLRQSMPSLSAVKEAGSSTVGRITSLPKSLTRLVRNSGSAGANLASGAGVANPGNIHPSGSGLAAEYDLRPPASPKLATLQSQRQSHGVLPSPKGSANFLLSDLQEVTSARNTSLSDINHLALVQDIPESSSNPSYGHGPGKDIAIPGSIRALDSSVARKRPISEGGDEWLKPALSITSPRSIESDLPFSLRMKASDGEALFMTH